MLSDDAFRLIHKALGEWVSGALEDGFQDDPIRGDYALDLMRIAQLMREIEGHTDVATD
jgi:hypothetical protein